MSSACYLLSRMKHFQIHLRIQKLLHAIVNLYRQDRIHYSLCYSKSKTDTSVALQPNMVVTKNDFFMRFHQSIFTKGYENLANMINHFRLPKTTKLRLFSYYQKNHIFYDTSKLNYLNR